MRAHLIAAVLFTGTSVLAQTYLNGPCSDTNGVLGVCIPSAQCDKEGGKYVHNKCMGTPDNIKCCTKPSCQQDALKGECRWVEHCQGGGKQVLQGLCPGPDEYRCCVTNGGGPANPVSSSASSSSALPSASGNSSSSAVPSSSSKKSSSSSKPTPKPTPKPQPTIGEKILKKAKEAEGLPYHWAGGNCKGPTGGGFDCSGLVSWALCQVTGRDVFSEGLRVTRSMYCASEKKLKYKKIKWANRRVGDAVFFGGKCDCANNPQGIHHVGLMMDSGWTMWNALKTGTKIRKDNFKNWDESPCPYVIRFDESK